MTNQKVKWTASNNSSFLNGTREAKSMLAAIREARSYLRNELYGEGTITYYNADNTINPIRIDRKDIFTGFKWETETFCYKHATNLG